MTKTNPADEPRPARRWALVAAGAAVLVAAAFGVIRTADGSGSSGPEAAETGTAGAADSQSAGEQTDDPAGGSGTAGGEDASGDEASVGDDTADDFEEGSLEPVEMEPAKTRDPVALDEPVELDPGLIARISAVEPVRGVARGPGEIAGPALRTTIRATNRSGERLSLDHMMPEISYGVDRTPAVALSGPGAKPLPAGVAAGESVTGTYVFNVPPSHRDRIQVVLTYEADEPTAVFRGAAR